MKVFIGIHLYVYALKVNLFFIQAHKNSLKNNSKKDFEFFISRAFELFTHKK